MKDYSISDFGIIFCTKELEYAALILKAEDNNFEYLDENGDIDEYCVAESIDLEQVSSFTGDAVLVDIDSNYDYGNVVSFSDETIIYANVQKWSTLFKAAYSSMSEIVDEMKKNYGMYLPCDFDYKSNIRKIVGTYYG